MNPLFSLFIVAMFLNDLLFNSGVYLKMYISALLLYTIFYLTQHRSQYHSPMKKYTMAAYDQSFDSTVYAKVLFDMTKTKKFLEEKSKEIGRTISPTMFFIKAVGEVYYNLPEANEIIRFGLKAKRKEIDIGVFIDINKGKDLVNYTLRDVHNSSFAQLTKSLEDGKTIKNGKNDYTKKLYTFLNKFPTFIIEILLEIAGMITSFGISIPFLGVSIMLFIIVYIIYVVGKKSFWNSYYYFRRLY